MCWIFSVVTNSVFSNNFKIEAPKILYDSIKRGPDNSNYLFVNDKIFLGSNRLRIIGDDTIGDMPLKSIMWNFWISFNGEIYNYRELKTILEKKGIKFYSNTDTEVVLNSYIYWWEEFVSKLNGIFAFVIFDEKENKIISARDRFGAKPLFYYQSNDFIAFSSEFLSLKKLIPKSELSIDRQALTSNILCRFVPGKKTIFKDLYKIEPAELLIFNIRDFKLIKRNYWEPNIDLKKFSQDEFNEKLSNALIKTSIADVQSSILLSGWIDSSALVYELYNNKEKLKTYCCSFLNSISDDKLLDPSKITNGSADESSKALKISKIFNTNHNHFIINSSIDLYIFKEMQGALWEPITVTNALGLYLFARKLNGKTKLVLSWTGSDELLWWYEELYFNDIDDTRKVLSNQELLNSFYDFDNWNLNPLNFLKKELQDKTYLEKYTENKLKCFLDNKLSDEYLNQLSLFELWFALPNWELDMADRLFMDNSIELRPSFLENDFLDYCLTIPSRNKKQKNPLREAMKEKLPLDIVNQRKIPSLSTPIDFLDSKCFKELIDDLKNNPLDIWNKEVLFDYLSKPYSKLSFDVLYRIIYLQSWLKEYYYKDYIFIKVTI